MTAVIDPGFSPQRVVSLVPSLTDSMVALGLGRFLVGATDLCPLPDSLAGIKRVGKPECVRSADIISLRPELVMASGEQNSQAQIDELQQSGLRMWVTFPRTVRQAVSDLRDLVLMYASETALQSVVWLDRSVDWLEGSRPEKRFRVFCPRKRKGPADHPAGWETVNGDTYAGDLLSLCGAENIFAGKETGRYPLVTPEEVMAAAPEVILLPEAPFPFSQEDGEAITKMLPDIPAVKTGRIIRIDGRIIFWPGTKLGEAIQRLPDLLRSQK
jgi:ABC-type Fe3+-hydroxamate transport system substrate-binding protein